MILKSLSVHKFIIYQPIIVYLSPLFPFAILIQQGKWNNIE